MIDSLRYVIVSKDENLNLSEIDTVLKLASEDKVHIDSRKEELLECIARQIHDHKLRADMDKSRLHEVHRWACLLHELCFVENKRNKNKEISEKTLETELFNTIERLFPNEPETPFSDK